MTMRTLLITSVMATMALAGCSAFSSEDELPPLEGDRISLFSNNNGIGGSGNMNKADQSANLPNVWSNEFWPQAGGYANHAMQHVSLNGGELKRVWSSSIGAGSKKDLPLTAQPVMADGRIYALDTSARVRALDASSGKTLWTARVHTEVEDTPVIGGGVAFGGGRLFVTAGYNEVLALDPATGAVQWRHTLPSATRAAPTFMPDQVFVTTVDNQTIALNAKTGERNWTQQGLTETTGLLGAASPAANRDIVVPAYTSGEIYAINATTGTPLWGDSIAPIVRGGGTFSAIRGLPVIDRGLVVAISYAGRIAAIEESTGQRIWDANIGGSQTPFVSGNRVFVISSNSEITSLDLATGEVQWRTQLERYRDAKNLKGTIVWHGPILAGNRLLAVSSNGLAANIDPKTGEIISTWKTGQDVVAAPIVANDTLYLLSNGGTLTAWK